MQRSTEMQNRASVAFRNISTATKLSCCLQKKGHLRVVREQATLGMAGLRARAGRNLRRKR